MSNTNKLVTNNFDDTVVRDILSKEDMKAMANNLASLGNNTMTLPSLSTEINKRVLIGQPTQPPLFMDSVLVKRRHNKHKPYSQAVVKLRKQTIGDIIDQKKSRKRSSRKSREQNKKKNSKPKSPPIKSQEFLEDKTQSMSIEDYFHSLVIPKKKEKKQAKRVSKKWNKTQTEMFYNVLEVTGLDFGLMEYMFKKMRTRKQLQRKYHCETKKNPSRIKEALDSHCNPEKTQEKLMHYSSLYKRIHENYDGDSTKDSFRKAIDTKLKRALDDTSENIAEIGPINDILFEIDKLDGLQETPQDSNKKKEEVDTTAADKDMEKEGTSETKTKGSKSLFLKTQKNKLLVVKDSDADGT